jgi:hypothetical protein
MKKKYQIQCQVHGREGIGLVCEHIAGAVDRDELVGFFWGNDTDTARPDAWWCASEPFSRSTARHPSNGSRRLASRPFVPGAGMRPNASAAALRAISSSTLGQRMRVS